MAGVYEFICHCDLRALVQAAKENGSTKLCISNVQLGDFKAVITTVLAGGLSNLQYLRADGNCFCGPLPELSLLKSLTKLNLSQNPLHTLTDGVGRLTMLDQLWLNGTSLEALPPSIGSLRNLQLLSAKGNRISSVPKELVGLTNLRWLIMEDNQISELPKDFCKFENLVHCNFNKNKISSLCPLIGSVKSLRYFYVADNNIVDVSSSVLDSAVQMELIDLRNNPLSSTCIQKCEDYPNVQLEDGSEDDEEDDEDDDDEDDDDDSFEETPNSTDRDSSEDEDGIEYNVFRNTVSKISRFSISAGC